MVAVVSDGVVVMMVALVTMVAVVMMVVTVIVTKSGDVEGLGTSIGLPKLVAFNCALLDLMQ